MKKLFLIIILNQIILNSQPKAKAELLYFPNDKNPQIGLQIILEKGWHIYWLNSGDSGIPTEIKWELPSGMSIVKYHWPIPLAFEVDGLVSYGYENKVIILFDVLIEDSTLLFNKEIICKINSLICKDVCIPFDTTITTKLDEIKTTQNLNSILKKNNIYFPEENLIFNLNAENKEDKIILEMSNFNQEQRLIEISFFPFENGIYKNLTKNFFYFHNDKYIIELQFDQFKVLTPKKVEGLLFLQFETDSNQNKKAYIISTEVNNKH